jgi:hypothetical protein
MITTSLLVCSSSRPPTTMPAGQLIDYVQTWDDSYDRLAGLLAALQDDRTD